MLDQNTQDIPAVQPIETTNSIGEQSPPPYNVSGKNPRKRRIVLGTVLFTLLLIGIGAVLYIVLSGNSQSKKLILTTNKTTVKNNEEIEVTAKFTNNSPLAFTANFSSGCNDPTVTINGKSIMGGGACTMALTKVEVGAYQSKEWKYKINADKIPKGQSEITAEWYDYNSNKVMVDKTIDVMGQKEIDACTTYTKRKDFCTELTLIPRVGAKQTAIESFLASLGVKSLPSPYMGGDNGRPPTTYYVQVPPSEMQLWVSKLTTTKSPIELAVEEKKPTYSESQ